MAAPTQRTHARNPVANALPTALPTVPSQLTVCARGRPPVLGAQALTQDPGAEEAWTLCSRALPLPPLPPLPPPPLACVCPPCSPPVSPHLPACAALPRPPTLLSPVRDATTSTLSAIWLEASDQQWESASALTHVAVALHFSSASMWSQVARTHPARPSLTPRHPRRLPSTVAQWVELEGLRAGSTVSETQFRLRALASAAGVKL